VASLRPGALEHGRMLGMPAQPRRCPCRQWPDTATAGVTVTCGGGGVELPHALHRGLGRSSSAPLVGSGVGCRCPCAPSPQELLLVVPRGSVFWRCHSAQRRPAVVRGPPLALMETGIRNRRCCTLGAITAPCCHHDSASGVQKLPGCTRDVHVHGGACPTSGSPPSRCESELSRPRFTEGADR
jgi:hypothetical protein